MLCLFLSDEMKLKLYLLKGKILLSHKKAKDTTGALGPWFGALSPPNFEYKKKYDMAQNDIKNLNY